MLLMFKLMKKAIVPTISHKTLYQIELTLYLPKPEKSRNGKTFY